MQQPSERGRYVIGVLKDRVSRGGSTALHEVVEDQDIRISEPRNMFKLDCSARRTLLFAGGIGVTPIPCMAEQLAAIGADFEMQYGARSKSRCGFYGRIKSAGFAEKVRFHFDDEDESQKLDIDAALGEPDPDTNVYVCGPAAFIDFVLKSAAAKGFSGNDERERNDQFAPCCSRSKTSMLVIDL